MVIRSYKSYIWWLEVIKAVHGEYFPLSLKSRISSNENYPQNMRNEARKQETFSFLRRRISIRGLGRWSARPRNAFVKLGEIRIILNEMYFVLSKCGFASVYIYLSGSLLLSVNPTNCWGRRRANGRSVRMWCFCQNTPNFVMTVDPSVHSPVRIRTLTL